MKKIFIFIMPILFFSSCAYKYMPMSFDEIIFSENSDTINKVSITYSNQNIFELSENKRPFKKSIRKEIYPLSVQINNTTSNNVNLNNLNIEIFNDFIPNEIIPHDKYVKKLKQKPLLHSVYLLGTIYSTLHLSNAGVKFEINYFTAIFTVMTLYNSTKAIINNKKFFSDIEKYELSDKTVPANSQFKGIIFIKATEIKDIKIRINEK